MKVRKDLNVGSLTLRQMILNGTAVPAKLRVAELGENPSSQIYLESLGYEMAAISEDGEHFEVKPGIGFTALEQNGFIVHIAFEGQWSFQFINAWDNAPTTVHLIQVLEAN